VPGGPLCFSAEDVGGEFEQSRARAVSLWNLETGEHRQVLAREAFVAAVTADGKVAAVSLPAANNPQQHESVSLFTVPEFSPSGKIALQGMQKVHLAAFLDEGRVLAGAVTQYDKPNDWQNLRSTLKCWSIPGGEELFALPLDEMGVMLSAVTISPDGRTIAATTHGLHSTGRKLILIDWPSRARKVVEFAADAFVRAPVFHPSGKFVIVPLQVIPRAQLTRDVDPALLPQPTICVFDTVSGQIVETLITTQAHQLSSAFSPDGNTLATSGTGEVLLWDFRSPPGGIANQRVTSAGKREIAD
jgi:WD40 repeat protein